MIAMTRSVLGRLGVCLLFFSGLAGQVPAAEKPKLPSEVMVGHTEFILIPEGWFYKTGGVRDGDKPENVKAWLDSYYIAKYEARARDLERYLNQLSTKPTPIYGGNEESCSLRYQSGRYVLVNPAEDLPATHLSWRLADDWSNWMGFRLPTEAEWEKAARGTDRRTYPWGDEVPDETYANFAATSNCQVLPVDRYSKGRSPYGVFNMAGNIREFVADWDNPEIDRAQKDGMRNPRAATPTRDSPRRMLKGGRWASMPMQMEINARAHEHNGEPFQCNGTRFAIDVSTVLEHLSRGTARILVP
jgi:iron(II)-dependent oxidoreductase